MDIRPLADHVVIELLTEEATASGIVLPDTAKENPQRGRVVAVGSGRLLDDGSRAPLEVSVQDVVLFDEKLATKVRVENHEYRLVSESDILAVLIPAPALV
ncbi:MAG: co-chaperone GroES [Sulfobacillus sp.]